MIKNSGIVLLVLLLLLCPEHLPAQGKRKKKARRQSEQADTLALFRQILSASSYYQQLPVQGEIVVSVADNIPVEELPPPQEIVFFLTEAAGYIRSGQTEQLTQDSLLVVVDPEIQRISLEKKQRSLAEQLKYLFQWHGSDSSLQVMAKLYEAKHMPGAGAVDTISLVSRQKIPGINTAFQDILMAMSAATHELKMVQTRIRRLLPLDEDEYEACLREPALADHLVDRGADGRFLLHERTVWYRFVRITHDASKPLPVNMSERIIRNAAGVLEPAPAYAGYQLLEH